MVKAKYTCSQEDLYAVAEQGWNVCMANLDQIQQLVPTYDRAYVERMRANINAVASIPFEDGRRHDVFVLRERLIKTLATCTDLWKMLKMYISWAFDQPDHNAQWVAAGWNFYTKAARRSWDDAYNLMAAGNSYIQQNQARLLEKGAMPVDFPQKFEAAMHSFAQLKGQYIAKNNGLEAETANKVSANNEIYTQLIDMLAIGAIAFRKEPDMQKIFSFKYLLSLIGGQPITGLGGKVLEAGSETALEGVAVVLDKNKKKATTDAKGRYKIVQVAMDTYVVSFQKEGYEPQSVTVEMNAGRVLRMKPVFLVPLAPPTPDDDAH